MYGDPPSPIHLSAHSVIAKNGKPSDVPIFVNGYSMRLTIFALRHDSGFDEASQSVRENAARDVQVCLQIVEAPNTVKCGPQDEQRPSIADQLEAAGEIAMARSDWRAADDWRGGHGRQNHLSCNCGLSKVGLWVQNTNSGGPYGEPKYEGG